MSHLSKLSCAVGLALTAAGLNAAWLNARKMPPQFVAVQANVPRGEVITDALLAPVPVPGDAQRLRKSLIPYSQRAILFGMETTRDYAAGDVVFQRDIQTPQQAERFEVLGPFQLISVGERFKNVETGDEAGYSPARGGNNVTIAVRADFDEQARRLLELINPQRSRQGDSAGIVAIQVVPTGERNGRGEAAATKGIVYQTVSLDGIENVPSVLLAGDVIRFVVPAEPGM